MRSSRRSTNSSHRSDDDDVQSPPPYSRNALNTTDDTMVDKEGETRPLLAGYKEGSSSNSSCPYVPARYVLAFWAFLGFVCLYAMRVNLSVAIVAMTAPVNSSNNSAVACADDKTNSSKSHQHYEFNWEPWKQGIILGAFFYGYLTTQIIVGNIAERIGGKWIFGGCILITGILTLLTPIAARADYRVLIALRILMGMVSGPGFPSAAVLWGKWIPPAERSTIPPAAQMGTGVGIIITSPLTSTMIGAGFLGGWPSAFYVFGVMSCVWFIGWCFFSFNSPAEHPRISEEELLFLTKEVPQRPKKHRSTPWKKIATCPAVYGISIMHVCYNFIYYTLLTSLPTYLATILHFDLHDNGLISALPYVAQSLVTLIVGRLVDYIRVRKILSITTLRKLQAIIGMTATCGFLIAIGYMGCSHIGAVTCCIFAVGCLGFQTCGAIISHLDVASNYAGTLVSITNTLATIPGFVGPAFVGAMTNNNQTVAAWRTVFNVSAGIGAFGALMYCILFNGEEQPWNRIPAEENPDEE